MLPGTGDRLGLGGTTPELLEIRLHRIFPIGFSHSHRPSRMTSFRDPRGGGDLAGRIDDDDLIATLPGLEVLDRGE